MSYRKLYRESCLTKVAPLASILWKRVARYSLFFFFSDCTRAKRALSCCGNSPFGTESRDLKKILSYEKLENLITIV